MRVMSSRRVTTYQPYLGIKKTGWFRRASRSQRCGVATCSGSSGSSSVKTGTLDDNVALTFAPPYKRSEEHTSELQSLMRISYAVFCLKKKNQQQEYKLKCQLFNVKYFLFLF